MRDWVLKWTIPCRRMYLYIHFPSPPQNPKHAPTRLEQALERRVDRSVQQARDAHFVDVQHSRVSVVEHERVPQLVVRGLVEGCFVCGWLRVWMG